MVSSQGERRMDVEERTRHAACWRGRRFLACRAVDDVIAVIDGLKGDDGSDPLPEGGLPAPPSEAHRREMRNAAANLLRIILLWNDGHVSPDELHRF